MNYRIMHNRDNKTHLFWRFMVSFLCRRIKEEHYKFFPKTIDIVFEDDIESCFNGMETPIGINLRFKKVIEDYKKKNVWSFSLFLPRQNDKIYIIEPVVESKRDSMLHPVEFVLFHEIGHHYLQAIGDKLKNNSFDLESELKADKFGLTYMFNLYKEFPDYSTAFMSENLTISEAIIREFLRLYPNETDEKLAEIYMEKTEWNY